MLDKLDSMMLFTGIQVTLFIFVTVLFSSAPIVIVANACLVAVFYKNIGFSEGKRKASSQHKKEIEQVVLSNKKLEKSLRLAVSENKILKSKLNN